MKNGLLDQAKLVRQGEELDGNKTDQWLKEKLTGLSGTPSITQYAGGASNWSYCLDYPQQSVILRRGPAGTKAKGAHDMGREYKLQHSLKPVFPFVPAMLGYCADENVIGAEFYVMEKLVGIIPRKNLPRDLKTSSQQTRKLCENFLDCLVQLHQVDYQKAELSHLGKGAGYTERQITGWSERYGRAKTWNVPSGKHVMKWLSDNLPTEERICITHNDFRFDNLVLDVNDYTKILGVLDWELATLGDPLMDLGNTLAYWVQNDDDFLANSTRRQPTHLPGMFTRKEVVNYYCSKMNIEVEDFTFYEVYGLFRLAAIAQQIYYRYHHGQTNNPAFKNFWIFVHYLFWRCKKAIRNQGKA